MREKTFGALALVCCLALVLQVQVAYGVVAYDLQFFTNNGNYYNDPDMDLYVEVLPEGGQARFVFHNDSLIDSAIANIYFDDGGVLLGIAEIDNGPGVSFSQGGSPGDLPAGNGLWPAFDADFRIAADSPKPHNGVNPGQWVEVLFDLAGGSTFADVQDKLNDQTLRIGAHVIALPDGSSESVVAPEPAGLALLLIGGLVFSRSRRR